MKLLREPLLHFLFVGVAIYLLYGAFAESVPEQTDKTIVVSAGEVEWMKTAWQERWRRPPTNEELDGLLQQYIRETVLYREALTMGLDQHDQVIRRRLAQKLAFLAKDLAALTPPTDGQLQAYFQEHRDRYQAPVRYTFTQVFIDPDRRGGRTRADAEAIKVQLIAHGDARGKVSALGDDTMLQDTYPEKDRLEIQKLFGSGFAQSLVELPPGQWHGPVLSGYGTHLVYVSNVSNPPSPAFAQVREQLVRDWTAERSEHLNENFYAKLREQYTIVIEQPAADDEVVALKEVAQ